MIIVDTALQQLEAEGRPIRVGLVGAGFAGKGFALQLLSGLPGLRLAAISNRTLSEAETAFRGSDVNDFRFVIKQTEGRIVRIVHKRLIVRDFGFRLHFWHCRLPPVLKLRDQHRQKLPLGGFGQGIDRGKDRGQFRRHGDLFGFLFHGRALTSD